MKRILAVLTVACALCGCTSDSGSASNRSEAREVCLRNGYSELRIGSASWGGETYYCYKLENATEVVVRVETLMGSTDGGE